jgi:hypothetical protein
VPVNQECSADYDYQNRLQHEDGVDVLHGKPLAVFALKNLALPAAVKLEAFYLSDFEAAFLCSAE